MKKVFVVGQAINYANWLGCQLVENVKECDVILFTGGEDVNPMLYDSPCHPTTYFTQRDFKEIPYYEYGVANKKHMLGICRGSQFLTVMNGGILVQHQENRHSMHLMTTWDNQEIVITSSHHQASYPFLLPEEDYKILAWTQGLSSFHEDGNRRELNPPVEVEMVYYPKSKSLGIQGHPEWLPKTHATIVYLKDLFDKFINNELEELTENFSLKQNLIKNV